MSALDENEEFEFRHRMEQEGPEEDSSSPFDSIFKEEVKAAVPEAEAPSTSVADFGRGAAQGATRGWQDEISPLFERGFAKLFGDDATQELYKSKTYEDLRDEYRRQNTQASERSPSAYGAGQLTGMLPGALASGGSTLAGNVIAGGLDTAANVLGESEQLDTEALKDAGTAALTSGAFTGAIGGGARLLDKGLKKVAPTLKSGAEDLARRALGNKKSIVESIPDKDKFGRMLLDEGIVGMGKSRDDILTDMIAASDEAGKGVGRVTKSADEFLENADLAGLSSKEIQDLKIRSNDIRSATEPKINELMNTPGRVKDAKFLEGYVDTELLNLIKSGDIGIDDLRQFRSSIDKEIKKWGGLAPDSGRQAALRDLRGVLEGVIEGKIQKIDDVAAPGLMKEYGAAKKEFGMKVPGAKLAKDTENRLAANNPYGMSEMLLGGTVGLGSAATSDNPMDAVGRTLVGAATGATLSRGIRNRGPQFLAGGLDKISKAIERNPNAFGKFSNVLRKAALQGPQELAVTYYVLSDGNPEFQEHEKGLEDLHVE